MLRSFCYTVLILVFLISGCSTSDSMKTSDLANMEKKASTTETVELEPEPYKKGLSFLNSGDSEQALTYFNLTVKDFPNSKYAYFSNVFRLAISGSYVRANINVMTNIIEITQKDQKMGLKLKNNQEQYQKELFSEKSMELEKIFNDSFREVLINYKKHKSDLVEINAANVIKMPDLYTGFAFDLIPEVDEVKTAIESFADFNLQSFLLTMIVDKKIDYASYFDQVIQVHAAQKNAFSLMFTEQEILDSNEIKVTEQSILACINEILDITKDDKYNTIRVKYEKLLNK